MVTQAILGLPPAALIGLALAFVFGGVVKGVTGVGLPLVLVPLASQFVEVPVAVALVSVSLVTTNMTQAAEGGHTLSVVRQMWLILVVLAIGAVIGVQLLLSIDRHRLNLILGVLFLALAAVMLMMPRLRIPRHAARWAGPLVGFAAGVFGGMSAIFGPPMIAYLVGLGTDPDSFVKQMAVFALTASATMLLALGGSGALSWGDLAISAAAVIPIQAGMPLGRVLRRRTQPRLFRLLVLAVLAAGGLDLMHRALF